MSYPSQRHPFAAFAALLALFALLTLPFDTAAEDVFVPDADYAPQITGGHVQATALQNDGKLLIGGSFTAVGGTPRSRIARLNADGSLDTGFAASTSINGTVYSIVPMPSGQILIGGNFSQVGSPDLQTRGGIARLNDNGSLDIDFIPPTITANPGDNRVFRLLRQINGDILVAGHFTNIGNSFPSRSKIARLTAQGTLDTSFQAVSFGNTSNDYVWSLSEHDGHILIGGDFTIVGGAAHANMARLTATGAVDPDFTAGVDGPLARILVQPSGEIVVAGSFTTAIANNGSTTAVRRIARFAADLTVDTAFQGGTNNAIHWMEAQTDGKWLIGGDFTTVDRSGTTVQRSKLARLLPDGQPDPNFNPPAIEGNVWTLVQQTDDRVIMGGNLTGIGGATRHGLARLMPLEPITYTVTTNGDGAGTCTGTSCTTFRAALTAANASPTNDVIEFATDVTGDIVRVMAPYHVISATAGGKLTLRGRLDASGQPEIRLNGNTQRVLRVFIGADVVVDSLGIVNGRAGGLNDDEGGGIRNNGNLVVQHSVVANNYATSMGGGIYNAGALTIRHSTVSSNISRIGGGIHNRGHLHIERSTLSDNHGSSLGAGIFIFTQDTVTTTIEHSTISGNAATLASPDAFGGGIYNARGSLSLIHSVVSHNSARDAGGGIYNSSSASDVTLIASVIANSLSGGDCRRGAGTINATGSLIEESLACVNGTNSGNLTGDPLLGDLATNGGPTHTHRPLPGSRLVDAVDCTLAADNTHDQRDIVRPQGSQCDIGAVEVRQFALHMHVAGDGSVDATPAPAVGDGIVDCRETTGECIAVYLEGDAESASLTATPDAGWHFVAWNGDCAANPGTPMQASVTMDSDKNCTASFARLINTAPEMTILGNQTQPAGATGAFSVPGFASVTSFGSEPWEMDQAVLGYEVEVLADPAGLLFGVPGVTPADGALNYVLSGQSGSANLRVRVRDDGGTADGGVDVSEWHAFAITVGEGLDVAVSIPGAVAIADACRYADYTVLVQNLGTVVANGVHVDVLLPASVPAATWTCTPVGGATCPPAGSGSIDHGVNLPRNAGVIYRITGLFVPGPNPDELITAQATIGGDIFPDNDTASAPATVCLFANGFEGEDSEE